MSKNVVEMLSSLTHKRQYLPYSLALLNIHLSLMFALEWACHVAVTE